MHQCIGEIQMEWKQSKLKHVYIHTFIHSFSIESTTHGHIQLEMRQIKMHCRLLAIYQCHLHIFSTSFNFIMF